MAAVHLHVPPQHGRVGHILFNMLALWMFGTDLERTWGTRFFTKYYFVTGIGAAATSLLLSLLDRRHLLFGDGRRVRRDLRTAARLCDVFPAPHDLPDSSSRCPRASFVIIVGAMAFMTSLAGPGSSVAHTAHLGGLVVGYLYLKGLRLAADGRVEVSLAALEDGPRPQPLRRLLGRPLPRRRLEERLEEAHPLD